MIPEYKSKANLGVGIGIVLEIAGRVLAMNSASPSTASIGAVLLLVGVVVFIYGCCNYALAKGQPGAWGLLGLLSIFGLIGLLLLPDRSQQV